MFSLLYALFALIHIAFVVWGMQLYRRHRAVGLLVILVPVLLLVFDNAAVAVGRLLGPGDTLLGLNWVRFVAHAVVTPLWIIGIGSLARLAGVRWVGTRLGMGALCTLAVLLIVGLGIPDLIGLQLHPACFADTVRYARSVSAAQLCSSAQTVVPSSGPPIPAIITIIVGMVMGVFVWLQARWPWLFVGALLMFIMAAVPPSLVGPALSSAGEIIMAAALLATAAVLLQRQTVAMAAT